mgnify:CR=1 FL=1|tara:strand:- start:115 stop:1092 length:978 start_codon:yes stop_codon:yes gene_type:complete
MINVITPLWRAIYAQQNHLKDIVPSNVNVNWVNLKDAVCAQDLDQLFRWYNTKNNYLFIDCTKEDSEIRWIVDNLSKIYKKYRIKEDHVYWVSSNPYDKNYVKHHIFWEMFLTSVKEMIPDRSEIVLSNRTLIKKFVCYNGRNRKWRRELYDRIKQRRIELSPSYSKPELLLQEFEYVFNFDGDDETKNTHFKWNVFNDISYDYEFWLVTETLFDDGVSEHVFLTEKIFKPLLLKMGFVVAGRSGVLKKLRDLGFKTFSDYWDESYDNILDSNTRMDAVVDTIEYIIINDVHLPDDILEYNFHVLKEHTADQELINVMSNLKPCK